MQEQYFVFKMSLCVQDKNLEWTPAERKSVLLIPVSWETLVSQRGF